MSININDIAKAAGVSTATVSRVISGKPGVSQETSKYVQSIIEEMGYRPNVGARWLSSKKTGNIGIVSSRKSNIVMGNPFFSTIIDGVSNGLDKSDYNMILSFTPYQQQKLLDTHSVDGVIVLAPRIGDNILDALNKSNVPTVIVGSYVENSQFPCVHPNDKQGIYEAVKYLIKNGHRKILLVNGPRTSVKSRRCEEGYLKAMKEEALEVDSDSIIELKEYDFHESFSKCEHYFLKKKNKGTAVVCASDYLALGVLKAAKKLNISVPKDLSVIGFGNVPITDFFYPELTTMHTDLVSIGKEAARMLISIINGKRIRKKQRIYDMDIIIRNSVRKREGEL